LVLSSLKGAFVTAQLGLQSTQRFHIGGYLVRKLTQMRGLETPQFLLVPRKLAAASLQLNIDKFIGSNRLILSALIVQFY
jgi:hypothetical protein